MRSPTAPPGRSLCFRPDREIRRGAEVAHAHFRPTEKGRPAIAVPGHHGVRGLSRPARGTLVGAGGLQQLLLGKVGDADNSHGADPGGSGKILDRNGQALADNRPSYNLDLYLEEFQQKFSGRPCRRPQPDAPGLNQRIGRERSPYLAENRPPRKKRQFALTEVMKVELPANHPFRGRQQPRSATQRPDATAGQPDGEGL